jgi:hypothetical protein
MFLFIFPFYIFFHITKNFGFSFWPSHASCGWPRSIRADRCSSSRSFVNLAHPHPPSPVRSPSPASPWKSPSPATALYLEQVAAALFLLFRRLSRGLYLIYCIELDKIQFFPSPGSRICSSGARSVEPRLGWSSNCGCGCAELQS